MALGVRQPMAPGRFDAQSRPQNWGDYRRKNLFQGYASNGGAPCQLERQMGFKCRVIDIDKLRHGYFDGRIAKT